MSRAPKTFADVIDQLSDQIGHEKEATSATPDTLATLEHEFRRIWTALEGGAASADPAADATDGPAGQDAPTSSATATDTPWLTIGLVGLVALIVGYLLGTRRSE